MTTFFRTNRVYLFLMLGALAAACGKQSPVGPTSASDSPATATPVAAPAATAPAVGGASISGVVRGGVGAAGVLRAASASAVKVSVAGTSISTMTDASGQFALNGVPAGAVTLAFESNGVNAALTLTVADGQRVSISVTMNGSTASLDSSQAVLGTSVELEGAVTGLAGTCPASVTFTVNGKTVKTDGATIFDGAPCASIVNGDRAEVLGTVQADSSILASKVEVKKAQAPPKAQDDADLEGVISGLKGVCPTVSFVVNGKTVTTTAATIFDSTSCASFANGQGVEVVGAVQPDSTILASKIEGGGNGTDDKNKGQEAEVAGAISGLKGACPAVSFVVNSKTVTTTAATKFDESPCSGLANGQSAEVKGTVQADSTILASEVDVEKPDDKNGGDGGNDGSGKGGKGKDDN